MFQDGFFKFLNSNHSLTRITVYDRSISNQTINAQKYSVLYFNTLCMSKISMKMKTNLIHLLDNIDY